MNRWDSADLDDFDPLAGADPVAHEAALDALGDTQLYSGGSLRCCGSEPTQVQPQQRPHLHHAAAWLGGEIEPRIVAGWGFLPGYVVYRAGAEDEVGYNDLEAWCADHCLGRFLAYSAWEVYFETLPDAEGFHDAWCPAT